MNMMTKYSIFIVLGLLFTRCDFINGIYWKDGDYAVFEHPAEPDCKILCNRDHGRVNCVTKIGSNENYIIVESRGPNEKYWFIEKSRDDHLMNDFEIVEGPYDLQTFNEHKIQKGITNLNFDKEF